MADSPVYKQVVFWVQQYGSSGAPDQRGIETFKDCETTEAVKILHNELRGIMAGNYKMESMDALIGVKRRVKHGSYEEWAKIMLLWLANYKT